VSILLKPFLLRSAEKIYRSFTFPKPESVLRRLRPHRAGQTCAWWRSMDNKVQHVPRLG
jgi:hypothetical protein